MIFCELFFQAESQKMEIKDMISAFLTSSAVVIVNEWKRYVMTFESGLVFVVVSKSFDVYLPPSKSFFVAPKPFL